MTARELGILFRSNVRRLREDLGMSQSELARQSGKTPGYICDLERGRRIPNLRTLADLSVGLRVLPEDLLSTKPAVPKKR